VSGRIYLEEIKAVGLADHARHAFFHQTFEKETKDLALNSVSSGSSNSEYEKNFHIAGINGPVVRSLSCTPH